MAKLPLNTMYAVSQQCPKCDSEEYKRVKAKTSLAFTDDRVCLQCGTRYTPPTPAWARGLFAVLGLGFMAGLFALAMVMFADEPSPYQRPIYLVLAGLVVGGVFLYKAFTTK